MKQKLNKHSSNSCMGNFLHVNLPLHCDTLQRVYFRKRGKKATELEKETDSEETEEEKTRVELEGLE